MTAGPLTVLARRLRPPLELALLAVAPFVFFAQMLAFAVADDLLAMDFRYGIAPAASAVLAGDSPYSAPDDPAIAASMAYVYPPLAALVAAPTTLVSPDVANVLVTVLLVVLVPVILAVAGVRDWRCYGAVLLWAPVLAAIQTGNVTLMLALALAVAWRFRTRPITAGIACGLMIATKLFLWPVIVWLLLVRGYRAAGVAVAATVAATLGPWAVIGFAGLREYPALLRHLADVFEVQSQTLFVVALDAGASHGAARVVTVTLGVGVLAAGVGVARRGDAARSLTLFVAAALVLSPIVWLHYFTLLLVPLAALRPRLSPLWLAPGLLWLTGPVNGNGTWWQTLLTLAVFAAITIALVRARSDQSARAAAPLPARGAAG